jgi:hypothetical protein
VERKVPLTNAALSAGWEVRPGASVKMSSLVVGIQEPPEIVPVSSVWAPCNATQLAVGPKCSNLMSTRTPWIWMLLVAVAVAIHGKLVGVEVVRQ